MPQSLKRRARGPCWPRCEWSGGRAPGRGAESRGTQRTAGSGTGVAAAEVGKQRLRRLGGVCALERWGDTSEGAHAARQRASNWPLPPQPGRGGHSGVWENRGPAGLTWGLWVQRRLKSPRQVHVPWPSGSLATKSDSPVQLVCTPLPLFSPLDPGSMPVSGMKQPGRQRHRAPSASGPATTSVNMCKLDPGLQQRAVTDEDNEPRRTTCPWESLSSWEPIPGAGQKALSHTSALGLGFL